MLKQVREFMTVMGQDVPDKLIVPSTEIQQLRFGLVDEENKEILEAATVNDIIGVLDGICDLKYVVDGLAISYGLSDELFKELFDEVHRSNMSKICENADVAAKTVTFYLSQGIDVMPKSIDNGKFVVCRVSDGKVLKSINWSEPNFTPILNKYGYFNEQS